MPASSHPSAPRPARGPALLRYALLWTLTGSLVAAAILVLLRAGGDEAVTLPPVRGTELTLAAERAGCELRSGSGERRPAAGEPLVDGAAGPPARPGFYDREPRPSSVVGAMRRGVVVIRYRPSLADDAEDELRVIQRAVPEGTLVVPDRRMRFVVAVTAWRRLLGCRRFGPGTRDAVRLFRGRYVGSGPDSPR